MGTLGVREETRAELVDRARWGALQAEALALLGQEKPEEARQLLERRQGEVPPLARAEYDGLVRQAARDEALRTGDAARGREDWAAAVAAYRDALEQGDPGSVARTRLAMVRAELTRRLDPLYETARASLAEEDEAAFARAAKLITELFNEDPGVTDRLEELQVRRALAAGQAALEKDDLDAAQRAFDTALRLRRQSPEVAAWLDRLAARRALEDEMRLGREAEAAGRWDEALEFYRRARERAQRDEDRRLLDAAAQRCRDGERLAAERRRRADALALAVADLRASKVDEAAALLEELAKAPGADPLVPRLLAFARGARDMVYVPAGPFVMGSAPGDAGAKPAEQPQRRVDVPAFFIGRTEVTNAQYAEFVATGAAPPPPHWTYPVRQPDGSVRTSFDPAIAQHPVVNVTWKQAAAYAAWRGGHLPSEPQWEKAARGTDGRPYPWGARTDVRVRVDLPPDRLREHPTAPVGAFGDDTSPYGAMDMAGNVGEWTSDAFGPYPGAPPGLDWPAGRRTIRGGAYRWPLEDARCAARDRGEEDGYVSPTVGLRLALDVPAELAPLR
jgi:formylglycine-generating enzyme required for sulfatase activity